MHVVTNGYPVESNKGDCFVVDLERNVVLDNEANIVFHFEEEDNAVDIIESGRVYGFDHILMEESIM